MNGRKGVTVSDTVLYDKDSHVVTITYHRPERMNAINGQMREELNAAWLRFRDDTDAWVAILTGAGRAFCAGADIREGGAAGTFAGTFWEKPTINSFESGLELFKPTIAAINGPCLGYGVTAIAFCDFVIASQRATFGFPEVRLGVPTIVGAIRMPQRLAWADAMELLLIGEPVDAEHARAMGLVWKVVHAPGSRKYRRCRRRPGRRPRETRPTLAREVAAGAAPGCCALLMAPAILAGNNQPYAVPPAKLAGVSSPTQ